MSRTVEQIEERLSPARLKEQVASVSAEVKESAIVGYREAKDQLKEDVQRELAEAKQKVESELTHARAAVREATVGKVEHMVSDARDTMADAGTTLLDTIRANPIPTALIGLGLGWLFVDRSRRSSMVMEGGRRRGRLLGERDIIQEGRRGIGSAVRTVEEGAGRWADQAQERASEVGEKVTHMAEEAAHRASEVVDEASVRGREAIRGASHQITRTERRIETTIRSNPLALGAIALAVGAAIAMWLPQTEAENQWMGTAKDRLVRRAEGVAGGALQKAEQKVDQLTSGEKEKTADLNGMVTG